MYFFQKWVSTGQLDTLLAKTLDWATGNYSRMAGMTRMARVNGMIVMAGLTRMDGRTGMTRGTG